ncbi:MAG: helix-turn-helix domain-containing protein [Blautia sp.]|nr:helix-turn-helix domain-containing protein [Blautia sp.]
MRYIKDYQEELDLFRALGSPVRLQIMKHLIENGRMSMNDLARALDLSAGAITPHVKKLEACDLLRINTDEKAHGNVKLCEPHLEKILIVFSNSGTRENEFHSHIRVGRYSSCQVFPTCGLSTASSIIGEVDDPRFFTHHKRFHADILWFSKGFVEYMVPCVIPRSARVEQFSMSVELSSEAPGSNPNWPSDIYFYLNGTFVGFWTSPGDFADVPGLFTPDWWYSSWNQYGLLKTLTIGRRGTFMDDERISDVTIDQIDIRADFPMYLKMEVPDQARHVGGLTVFGRGFGNYNQDIEFRIRYKTM